MYISGDFLDIFEIFTATFLQSQEFPKITWNIHISPLFSLVYFGKFLHSLKISANGICAVCHFFQVCSPWKASKQRETTHTRGSRCAIRPPGRSNSCVQSTLPPCSARTYGYRMEQWTLFPNHPVYSKGWKALLQTTTCVTEGAKQSTLFYCANPFNWSWKTKDLGCGLLGIWCHTGGSLRRVLPETGWLRKLRL